MKNGAPNLSTLNPSIHLNVLPKSSLMSFISSLTDILERFAKNNFYEYYFEPNGKRGQCFFQFFHEILKLV